MYRDIVCHLSFINKYYIQDLEIKQITRKADRNTKHYKRQKDGKNTSGRTLRHPKIFFSFFLLS